MNSVFQKYSKNPKGKVIRARSMSTGHAETRTVKAQSCGPENQQPKSVLMIREYEEEQAK